MPSKSSKNLQPFTLLAYFGKNPLTGVVTMKQGEMNPGKLMGIAGAFF
jgi:hypothetical protein